MAPVTIRPADPKRDFAQLAVWFSMLEEGTTTETELQEYYEKRQTQITQRVAENDQGELLGFYWSSRNPQRPEQVYFDLMIIPEARRQGLGRQLYEDFCRVLATHPTHRLRIRVWDNCPEGLRFAEQRGFSERAHQFAMALDLDTFNDQPYEALISRLQNEGFLFTSLEALGNTEEAQRRLYHLNETTGMDIPGTDGEPSWVSFEDFQASVCQADWYKPAGQMVVIDKNTGTWAAMSAITSFAGDSAYNLHTGVARAYRGRKIAQAVKVLALRYAREVLQVHTVRTHHNAKNAPMIAIDQKFGYVRKPGTYLMEKFLD